MLNLKIIQIKTEMLLKKYKKWQKETEIKEEKKNAQFTWRFFVQYDDFSL